MANGRPRNRRRNLAAVGIAVAVGLGLAGAPATAGSTFGPSNSGDYDFISAPGLHPPKLQVLRHRPGIAPGDFLVSNNTMPGDSRSSGEPGVMLVDSRIRPVWFVPAPAPVANFAQETYNGNPVLLWIRGGEVEVVNEHYRKVATLRARAPWDIDGHDAWIVGGDVWVVVLRTIGDQNLRAYGGPSRADVLDSGLQEYDLKTGRLLRTWDALNPGGKANVPLSASEQTAKPPRRGGHPRPTGPGHPKGAGGVRFIWDPYHLNSVEALPNGDLLVSMRNTWAVYLIDPKTNRVVWTLGGKDSTFKLGRGARFDWQHDARLVHPTDGGLGSDVDLTLFNDNNGTGTSQRPSAGMVLSLNTRTATANLVHAYRHHPALRALVLGSMQLLPNGNALVGWGSEPYFSEYSRSGRELLDVRWPGVDRSYRALFTDTWVGTPDYPPRGASRGSRVYASWNGATQVATWEVLAGQRASHLRVVATRARTGFETAIRLGRHHAVYEVRALSSTGHALGTSKPFSGVA